MQPFRVQGRARLTATANFAEGPVLNLDFLDETAEMIPFHLSLRRDEGLVVVNRRDAAGWRREIRFALSLPRARVTVEIDLSPRHAAVHLDGRLLGRFDALPRPSREGRFFLRRGFPDLGRIALLRAQGLRAELRVAQAGPVPSGLHLTDGLSLALACDDPPGGCALHLAGCEPLPLMPGHLPQLAPDGGPVPGLLADLPGRVWIGAPGLLLARLLAPEGAELGQITLSRQDIAQRLPAALASGEEACVLLAIEHARHGALVPMLPAAAQEALFRQVRRFGLEGWMPGPGGAERPAAPPPPRAQPAAEALQAALRADPGADPRPLLQAALASIKGQAAQLSLLDRMVEWACLTGHVEPLETLRRGLLTDQPPPAPDGWSHSVALPRLWLNGDWSGVAAALRHLATLPKGWMLTPAPGWIARAAARWQPDHRGNPPQDWQCADIVHAFADLIESQVEGYWSRLSCQSLRGGLIALLAEGASLPAALRERLVWLAIRAYGLDPAFWAARPADPVAHPALIEARQGFAALVEAVETGAGAEALAPILAQLRALGCAGIDRFARDLLGPGAGADRAESRLRALLAPGATDPGTPDDPPILRAALAQASSGVPAAPLREAALLAVQRAGAVLAGGPVDPLVQVLPALGGGTARFAGLALAMDTARGLLALHRSPEADVLLTLALHLARIAPAEGLAASCSPALARAALLHAAPSHPRVRQIAQALPGAPLPPVTDLTADLHAQASPVQDTVLCLYSCRAHLDTRVAAIRQGWGQRLAAMGVPMLVFVGGGDGSRQGDVVALDCPDDYEGLPQKTLAMVRWVRDHTRFAHLVKVDDDCALDPAGWFGDLAHRQADYYGRPLHRVPGQMDRAWHMAKSSSARGRLQLDRSPEPSTYADGGSGYALSRRAMAALLAEATTPEGQRLISRSFMEDKLTGDLLARRGIWVDGTDYRVSVLRRVPGSAQRVAHWENGVGPFAGSGLRLVHLDGIDGMQAVVAGFDRPVPAPGKIWPTFQPLRLGARSNTLDLLTPPARLDAAREVPVAVIACLRNEAQMLPHFLAHYRALGVGAFLVADNGSDDGGLDYLCAQPDVSVFAVDTEYSQSTFGVAWQQALMAHYRCGRWSLVADADELLLLSPDRRGDLPGLVAGLDAQGADAARVFMLDLYPEGPLEGADLGRANPFDLAPCCEVHPFLARSTMRGPFSDAPVFTSALRHRLVPGARPDLFVAQKVALLKYRPWMRLTAGLHFVAGTRLARHDLLFAHFKYTAAFHARVQAEVARRQHFNDAEEYRQYQALLAEGRSILHDPAHSVRWQDCALVRHLLAGGRIGDQGSPE